MQAVKPSKVMAVAVATVTPIREHTVVGHVVPVAVVIKLGAVLDINDDWLDKLLLDTSVELGNLHG